MRCILCLLLIGCATCGAQTTTQPVATPPPPCQTPQHRQFDFWLGQWQVTGNGVPAGTNHIELRHGGCVLHESWSSTGSFSGNSLNLYDAQRQVWHQTWADSSGLLLQMEGGFSDGAMTLSGQRPGANGTTVTHQIQWTPGADGSVRQLWRTSTDGGETWQVAFDGLYQKSAP